MQLLLAAASKNPQLNNSLNPKGSNTSSSSLDPDEAIFLAGGKSSSFDWDDSSERRCVFEWKIVLLQVVLGPMSEAVLSLPHRAIHRESSEEV